MPYAGATIPSDMFITRTGNELMILVVQEGSPRSIRGYQTNVKIDDLLCGIGKAITEPTDVIKK
jgi:hypothetical protein